MLFVLFSILDPALNDGMDDLFAQVSIPEPSNDENRNNPPTQSQPLEDGMDNLFAQVPIPEPSYYDDDDYPQAQPLPTGMDSFFDEIPLPDNIPSPPKSLVNMQDSIFTNTNTQDLILPPPTPFADQLSQPSTPYDPIVEPISPQQHESLGIFPSLNFSQLFDVDSNDPNINWLLYNSPQHNNELNPVEDVIRDVSGFNDVSDLPDEQSFSDEVIMDNSETQNSDLFIDDSAHINNNSENNQDGAGPSTRYRINNDIISHMYKYKRCLYCNQVLNTRALLDEHIFNNHREYYHNIRTQYGGGREPENLNLVFELQRSLYNDQVFQLRVNLKKYNFQDIRDLFDVLRQQLKKVLLEYLSKFRAIKIMLHTLYLFSKDRFDLEIAFTHWINSYEHVILHKDMIDSILLIILEKIVKNVEEYCEKGSGLFILDIPAIDLIICPYDPFKGGTYLPLPFILAKKRGCIINVNNSDEELEKSKDPDKQPGENQMCFLWSVLAGRDYVRRKWDKRPRNFLSVDRYRKYVKSINTKGIIWPMTLCQIEKFERQNSQFSITVLGYEPYDVNDDIAKLKYEKDLDKNPHLSLETRKNERLERFHKNLHKKLSPLYVTKCKNAEFKLVLIYLSLDDDDHGHFILVTNLNKLLTICGSPNLFYCHNCLHHFTTDEILKNHTIHCSKLEPLKTHMPDKPNYKFEGFKNMIPPSYRIIADFECFLKPNDDVFIHRKITNPHEYVFEKIKLAGEIDYYESHIPCGYSWICIDSDDNVVEHRVYRAKNDNEDVARIFLREICSFVDLLTEQIQIHQERSKRTMLNAPEDERPPFGELCWFCDKEIHYTNDPWARHHSHMSPYEFVGWSHQKCNALGTYSNSVTVIFHNFSSYDSHPIILVLDDPCVKNKEVITLSSEKFLSLIIETNYKSKIKFIDSCRFLNNSLANLTDILAMEGDSMFKVTNKIFSSWPGNPQLNLLYQKLSFPYSSFKCVKDFEKTTFPTEFEYFNELTQSEISSEDYKRAKKVWDSFKINNYGQLMEFYNLLDVCLLTDIWINFERLFVNKFKLWASHYFSISMLSMDCALRFLKFVFKLMMDIEKHLFMERGSRGGYAGSGGIRYAKANNPYMQENFDPDEIWSFIMNFDYNMLYCTGFTEPVPVEILDFLSESLKSNFTKDHIMSLAEDSEFGFYLEVDLSYPEEMHNYFNCFPPAPVRRSVKIHELSERQRKLRKKLNIKSNMKIEKLIADLHPNKNYVLHYRSLQRYLQVGLKLDKVHKILKFRQQRVFARFMEFCAEMRKNSSNKFHSDMWKLVGNSIFGKSLESVRDRVRINIVTKPKVAKLLLKKPTLKDVIVLTDTISLFVMRKTNVVLNKPIYLGISVLDFSKSHMVDFYYNYLKRFYGNDVKLICTDTDSFMVNIVGKNDPYEDAYECRVKFDNSVYDPQDPLFGRFYDPTNRKKMGCMKDVSSEDGTITEFVMLKPKMYAYETHKGLQKKTLNGITRGFTQDIIQLADYKKSLFESTSFTAMNLRQITSMRHKLMTARFDRNALDSSDTKRFHYDNINSLAFGHKDIVNYLPMTDDENNIK